MEEISKTLGRMLLAAILASAAVFVYRQGLMDGVNVRPGLNWDPPSQVRKGSPCSGVRPQRHEPPR